MKTITIVAFDKFTDIDVFLAWDLFNRIRLREKECQVRIVGTAPAHVSVCGIELKMHGPVDECNAADIVFFSSGPGTRKLFRDAEYLARFSLDPGRQIIGSMCSGALILAALGLLQGKSATTYPTAIPELKALGVEVEERPIVAHGNVATAAGCLAAVDLVSWMTEKAFGTGIRDAVVASVQPVGKGLECIYA